jgi:Holliday junction resolvase RusA-like endonuclease
MDPITFTVIGLPVAQPRQRHRIMGKGREAFVVNYTPRGGPVQSFKARCRNAWKSCAQGAPLEGPLLLELVFVMPRPMRLFWKSRPMVRVAHDKKPDLDNLQKGLFDALSKRAWHDDAQIVEVLAKKFYAGGHEEPHVEVVIRMGGSNGDAGLLPLGFDGSGRD